MRPANHRHRFCRTAVFFIVLLALLQPLYARESAVAPDSLRIETGNSPGDMPHAGSDDVQAGEQAGADQADVTDDGRAVAAIASAHPLATQAGLAVLEQGGNAFDAAIAVTAVLAVVEPYSSGLGGGGFYLLHEAGKQRNIMLDARERAPLRAHRDMFLDEQGEVIKDASITGALAAGIPGVPAALVHLAENYARLPLEQTLAPAIRLAREGFVVDEYYRRMAGFRLQDLRKDEEASRIFLQQGNVPEAGYRIVQQDLAVTLENIAREGFAGFYENNAWSMAKDVRRHGGIWTVRDLGTYRVLEREPQVIVYKGMKMVTAMLPSSGGIVLTEILGILSQFNLEDMAPARRVHVIVEAMRRAYRDRAEYMGDPDYVDVPVDQLVSEINFRKMARGISLHEATPSSSLPSYGAPAGNGTDTTHFSIVDAQGNRVSATLSINYPFGACYVPKGTGVLLNDEMDDFSVRPGTPNVYGLLGSAANAIEPGKRMLSSMTPTFAETRDRIAVIGTPGGSRIITMVLLGLLDFYEGRSPRDIVDKARFHHQYMPDVIFYEPGALDSETIDELQLMGHQLQQTDSDYGNMQLVIINKKDGGLEAASDRRGVGFAGVMRAHETTERRCSPEAPDVSCAGP